VDLRDARLRGLEALIRWRHPERGLVQPGEFIPLLEESGLILKVGRWVMQTAAQQYRRWKAAGLQPPPIAVNVSPQQLRHAHFVKEITQLLAEDPRGEPSLDIELTESVFLDNLADGVQKLHGVRALGVRVAIDDFGVGYSSLAYLARLPIDFLKVDRSFVSVMTEDPNDMAIVSSIITLAHGLDLKVIAEGVETVEQRKLLQLLRCDQMQGYLYSKPTTVQQIEELLHAESAFGTGTMRVLPGA
jgi:EAL domain-containing protein (putative c-di-GMP-specific phosphodiesterase class I)